MNIFFLQGLQHPLLTPVHLITLIALGVFLGQQAGIKRNSALTFFVIFTLVGLLTTQFYQPEFNLETVLLVVAGLIGVLITLKNVLQHWSIAILSLHSAVIIGLDSAPIMIPGLSASKIYSDMAGTLISASVILVFVSLVAMLINKLWQGIILRIMGAWIFASTLMVLALMFAPVRG